MKPASTALLASLADLVSMWARGRSFPLLKFHEAFDQVLLLALC